MATTITQKTLDLINQAEGDLQAATDGDASAATAQQAAATAQATATGLAGTAAQLHVVATDSALAALAALRAELGLPPAQ